MKLIKHFVDMSTKNDKNAIILDFFSGSATTAHAVMQLNAEDGGHRKYILIQIPEKTDEKSEAYKAGFSTISEIGIERIHRVGDELGYHLRVEYPVTRSEEWLGDDGVEYKRLHQKVVETERGGFSPFCDIGLRVFRVDSSNMEDVYYTPAELQQDQLTLFADNIKPDRTPEDLLFQVMLDLGILLSSEIEETEIAGKKVFSVAGGYLIACFDKDVTEEAVTEIAKKQPFYAVFRDSGMATDSVSTNFEQIFETYSPKTVRRVI